MYFVKRILLGSVSILTFSVKSVKKKVSAPLLLADSADLSNGLEFIYLVAPGWTASGTGVSLERLPTQPRRSLADQIPALSSILKSGS